MVTSLVFADLIGGPSGQSDFGVLTPSLLTATKFSYISVGEPSTPATVPTLTAISVGYNVPPIAPFI